MSQQGLFTGSMHLYLFNRRWTMHLKVIITKGEDGWYVVTVPSLPGCITQGKTIKEAKENIKEAISLYLEPEEEIILGKGARVIDVAV
jgi:predicted RNase H-like HicB family nuclease